MRPTEAIALERRIDELCKENEKLRQQVASIIDRSFRTADKMNCLEAENAKLRELVRDMYETIEARNTWWDAFAKDSKRYADRMRELGVDDG